MTVQRLALCGQFRAGKDWLAERCGYKILSFSEPMYRLVESVFGFCDKNRPDHRRLLQHLGQIGWGCDDGGHDPYPSLYGHSLERAMLTDWIRHNGARLTSLAEIPWQEFGTKKTFWVDALLAKLENSEHKDERVAVVNVRFQHELEPLQAAGFKIYLVAASHATREQRNGRMFDPATEDDPSEQLAKELWRDGETPAVWNDDAPMPLRDPRCITAAEFIQEVTQ